MEKYKIWITLATGILLIGAAVIPPYTNPLSSILLGLAGIGFIISFILDLRHTK
jgi:hypothetical protein